MASEREGLGGPQENSEWLGEFAGDCGGTPGWGVTDNPERVLK